MDRRLELVERKAGGARKRGLWGRLAGLLPFGRRKPPVVRTPLVLYRNLAAFDVSTLAAMDVPERVEHIRIAKLRREIQPTCEYDVLFYSEVPRWLKQRQYGKRGHLTPPTSVAEAAGQDGVFISLTRARLVAQEIAAQGCFGAIVGFTPKGFVYEAFGGHEDFVESAIKPDVYEKAYRLAREYEFKEAAAVVGSPIAYELVEGAREQDTPTLREVRPPTAEERFAHRA